MSSNPDNVTDDEDFEQISLISTCEITWKIRNFQSPENRPCFPRDSPTFDFQNATWCLRLCEIDGRSVVFILVRLCSSVPYHALRFNLIWADKYRGMYSKVEHFDEGQKEGKLHFLSDYYHSYYEKDFKTLTLICQISCNGSPVADAFSQTELETKIPDRGDLCQNLKNLLLDGRDHDLILKVKEKEFHAHQNILRARSPVFKSTLSHDMIEKNSGVIDIPDCDPEAFEQFLLYLYVGEVETLDTGNMLALYYTADKYDARHLKNRCRETIRHTLTSTNVSDVIQLALNHGDAGLLESATDYFVEHVSVVLCTAEWRSFAKCNIIQTNELFIKAARYLEAGKKYRFKKTKIDENFNQIDLMSTREITWKINEDSMRASVNKWLDSPPFYFENATWCLRLYLKQQETQRGEENYTVGITIVRLRSDVPHHRLRYNFMWLDENYGNDPMEDYFDDDHKENGDMLFFDISFEVYYHFELQIIMCHISSYESPVADAFSQTVQDTESIGDLCQNFKNLLLNAQDHDLVLKVKGREFRAHQNILRARSPGLETVLNEEDMIGNSRCGIEIPDCDPEAFEQFLLYLYGGEVETLDTGNMLSLYYIADKYDAGHLKDQCREFVENSLTSTNVADVIQLALKHSDAVLLECATDCFVHNVGVVLRTVEWQSFVTRNPIQANELFIKATDIWDAESCFAILF